MFGIEDPSVALALVLCGASSVLCVVYSWINWNRGEEELHPEDIRWAQKDEQVP